MNNDELKVEEARVPQNPVWYWYRWLANNGAHESVLEAIEKDAERYDVLRERKYSYEPARGPRL